MAVPRHENASMRPRGPRELKMAVSQKSEVGGMVAKVRYASGVGLAASRQKDSLDILHLTRSFSKAVSYRRVSTFDRSLAIRIPWDEIGQHKFVIPISHMGNHLKVA
ncbi:hypothetical protein RF11_13903 [Thelohanellus kitauei]|uniref:Uncharacterized protein n=1 Tax=Thelohanellus kitauei TaxID=669202 RepID=A0A0C2M1H6_THEKT|nr:hypothetical protein RF11_13903 [Thelohanellus kitauei]